MFYLKPKKRLGQNFLVDKNIARKIVQASNLNKEDVVLEIGPGKGFLTDFLISEAKNVVAVELDKGLFKYLEDKFKDVKNINLVLADILKINFKDFKKFHINKIVANIPYNITSQIIFKLIYENISLESVVLMVQKEVADRILSKPNNKVYGMFSIISQLFFDVEFCFNVSKNVFSPKPKINSAVLKFSPKQPKPITDKIAFINFVKRMFSFRRKVLLNVISRVYKIDKKDLISIWNQLRLPFLARPENLSPTDWLSLYEEIRSL